MRDSWEASKLRAEQEVREHRLRSLEARAAVARVNASAAGCVAGNGIVAATGNNSKSPLRRTVEINTRLNASSPAAAAVPVASSSSSSSAVKSHHFRSATAEEVCVEFVLRLCIDNLFFSLPHVHLFVLLSCNRRGCVLRGE